MAAGHLPALMPKASYLQGRAVSQRSTPLISFTPYREGNIFLILLILSEPDVALQENDGTDERSEDFIVHTDQLLYVPHIETDKCLI